MKLLLLALLLSPFLVAGQTTEDPAIQAILFYTPTCPHCHQVINEVLIPMQEQYGDQLQIIGIDTSHQAGSELYQKAIERFEVPQNQLGVPTLVVGDTVLVGSIDIPARFPAIIEAGLSAGGIGWPDIPDLAVAIPDLPPPAGPGAKPETVLPATVELENNPQDQKPIAVPTTVPSEYNAVEAVVDTTDDAPGSPQESVQPDQSLENVNTEATFSESAAPPADPVGFSLAGLVLLGMVVALFYVIWKISISRSLLSPLPVADSLSWAVPILAFIGLSVSLYLSYVEVARVEAVCGPVGACNIVQTSAYASLLGIPIAVLGVLSYIAIAVLWIGQRILHKRSRAIVLLALGVITIFGAAFSAYLTMMELFVIRAVCAWCLTSAVIATLIMILVVRAVDRLPSPLKLEAQS